MRRRVLRHHLLVALGAASLLPGAAIAQLEEIIVTAQKREESAQDVPIAVTAFDEELMRAKQITGFADMRYTAPNVTFTKANFTGSNFQIRGIGTTLVAASADSGVGVHVNEVPLLTPRLFETEYFDVEQVAVLRGPQGTLYGRNSTGGAVNMVTRAADTSARSGNLEAQYGDYDHARISGALNVPLGEQFAVRLAGLWLERDGYTENLYTGNDVDGRDQYSLRGSLRWTPGEATTVDLMASYFEEDSTRARSQKTMCRNDPGGVLGCLPDALAWDLPNPSSQLSNMLASTRVLGPLGIFPFGSNTRGVNPSDFRKVYADRDPVYESDEALLTLGIDHELENHTLALVAGYQDTAVDSQMDYLWNVGGAVSLPALLPVVAPRNYAALFADGLLPMSAPSKNSTGVIGGHVESRLPRLEAYDQSNRDSEQYSIEARIQSNYGGAFDFLLGGFWMDVDLEDQYWVIANGFDYLAGVVPALFGQDGSGWVAPLFNNSTDDYRIESSALFGEVYYQLTDGVKLTLGGRYTVDRKEVRDHAYLLNRDPVTTARLLQPVGADLPIPAPERNADEEWKEFTGRAVVDWSVTDGTLLYASYSRGYKGGGFNPPFNPAEFPDQEPAFEPEFVNAIELGAKNTLLGNTLQANVTAFFYDYSDLQVSKIVNRTSFNENTDAEIFGLESELLFAPDEHWQLNANLAYLKTEIQDFSSVDTRDPTAGRSDVTLVKDTSNASNCVVHHNGAPPPALPSQFGKCFTDVNGAGLADTLPDPYTVTPGVAVDLEGNALQNSPEWSVSVGAQYTFALPRDYRLALRLDYYWQDQMYGRIFNRRVDEIDSWDVWNAQANLTSPGAAWYLRAYIKNIADDDNVVGMYLTDPSSGLFTNVFTIEPRTYGMAVGYNF